MANTFKAFEMTGTLMQHALGLSNGSSHLSPLPRCGVARPCVVDDREGFLSLESTSLSSLLHGSYIIFPL